VTEPSSPSRVERFLAHLDGLSGGVEPRFFPVESTHEGLKGITVITYLGVPEPGMMTAITYGISLADHPEWRFGKPELCIAVRTDDVIWARAVGFVAEQLRGDCPFSYGDTLSFGARVTPDSDMDAFVVFAPAVMNRDDFLNIDVGDDRPINIAGIYPIHESERQFIRARGLEAFWKLDCDLYDVRRPSTAQEASTSPMQDSSSSISASAASRSPHRLRVPSQGSTSLTGSP
jgi:hypothetical protein